jgi:putative ABC transport system permease protein
VLGRNISARIANLRAVDWQSLGINFVLVFSPNTFRGAPHTHMATLTFAHSGDAAERTSEDRLIRDVAAAYPGVSSVRVRDALDAIGAIVRNLVLAVRGASVVTLLAAALVLGGALAASQRHRVYDAVILKTLGATRRRLLTAYLLEYLLLAFATAAFGVLAGSLSAWAIVTELMNLPFVWLPLPALAASLVAVAVTVVLGLAGTARALGQKPAAVLRNL